jgi:hypothetical protein
MKNLKTFLSPDPAQNKEKNDYSDIPKTDAAFWAESELKLPPAKQRRRLTDHK